MVLIKIYYCCYMIFLNKMLRDLYTFLEKAVPDTKLTLKKYSSAKFEFLVRTEYVYVFCCCCFFSLILYVLLCVQNMCLCFFSLIFVVVCGMLLLLLFGCFLCVLLLLLFVWGTVATGYNDIMLA